MLDKQISDFLLTLHDASMHLAPTSFRHWALGEVQRYVDFDFAMWGAGDGVQRELHTATIFDQSEDLFSTWEAVKEEDPYAHLVIGNTGKTWALSEIPDMYETRAYNEHWQLYRARQMISTMQIDPHTGLHIFVTLAREQKNADFTHDDIRFKNLVTQHLFMAATHNDRHFLSTFRAPAALVDRHGLLHAALPDFVALVSEEWGDTGRRQLPPVVIGALWQTGRYRGNAITLTAEPAGERLLVRAEQGTFTALSTRENEVAWAYARGHSHKEVARELSIAPATVRSHISRIYEKLDIRDKGALALWLQEHGGAR